MPLNYVGKRIILIADYDLDFGHFERGHVPKSLDQHHPIEI